MLENWLTLYHAKGVGVTKFHDHLLLDPALENLPTDLDVDWLGVERDLLWLNKNHDAQIITLHDDNYPSLLKNIGRPPPLLYVAGDSSCLAAPQIAMVGSRNPSTAGLQQAGYFAKHFAELGFIVNSGLAVGIDAACHNGALNTTTGKTIAVLAQGLDSIYPRKHEQLAARIKDRGCLVSEFPIGTQPLANHFPGRNRIISGLSVGVLVVEAALSSGSLITARYAAEQGREVFAIPGSIHNPKVKGCHQLIRQGAKLVESAEDVLEEIVSLLNCVIRDKNATLNNQQAANLSEQQGRLLRSIDYEPTCVDSIVGRTGLAAGAVSAILLELELDGFIAAVPGGYARKLG